MIGWGICAVHPAAGQEFQPGLDRHVQVSSTSSTGVGGLGFSVQVRSTGWPELGRYLTPFVANFRGGDPARTSLGR